MKKGRIFLLVFALLFFPHTVHVQGGVLLRLSYDGIPGGGVERMRASPMYPDHATRHEVIYDRFDVVESAGGELFGSLFRGFLEPPLTGDYKFWISSDDNAEFWLSSDHDPKNLPKEPLIESGVVLLIDLNNPPQRFWAGAPESQPVHLVRGKKYYFEVQYKENGGGDHVALGWQLPDGTLQRPIQLKHVSPFPLNQPVPLTTINPFWMNPFPFGNPYGGVNPFLPANPFPLQNPFPENLDPFNSANIPEPARSSLPASEGYSPKQTAPVILTSYFGFPVKGNPISQTARPGDRVEFQVIYEATQPASLQWRSNGVPIPGAILSTYIIPHAPNSFAPIQYDVVITNSLGAATSAPALLAIATTTLMQSRTYGSTNSLDVDFAVDVDPAVAMNTASYTIAETGGAAVPVEKVTSLSPRGVRLSTGFIRENATYTLKAMIKPQFEQLPAQELTATFVQVHGVIEARRFENIIGMQVAELMGDSKFINGQPDRVEYPGYLELPPNVGVNNGVQMVGFLTPTVSGTYQFAVSSADEAQLFLGTGASPESKRLIAMDPPVFGGTVPAGPGFEIISRNAFREYVAGSGNPVSRINPADPGRGPVNLSGDIPLDAGKKYYIEVLRKSGAGSNNLSVAWRLQTDPPILNNAVPIPPENLSAFGSSLGPVHLLKQPAPLSVIEFQPATFTVNPDGAPPYFYQWMINDQPAPGANERSFTIPFADEQDHGKKISVVISNRFSSVKSDTAILSVQFDPVPPTLLSARTLLTGNGVLLEFSEPVDSEANNSQNYSIADLPHQQVQLQPDNRHVILQTDPQLPGREYVLTVNGIADLSPRKNPIAPDSRIRFTAATFTTGKLRADYFENIPGRSLQDLSTAPKVPLAPDEIRLISSFSTPENWGDNFAVRIAGFIVPPESGDYRFFIRSADESELRLGSGSNPDAATVIAQEPECCHPFMDDDIRSSAPQSLIAGERYYIEAWMKAGEGKDFLQVAWRKQGDPTSPGNLQSISGEALGVYVAPGDSGTPAVELEILPSGAGYLVRWPQSARGAKLQSTTKLENSASWIDVPGSQDLIEYSFSPDGVARYFRLVY